MKLKEYIENNKTLSLWKKLFTCEHPIIKLQLEYLEKIDHLNYTNYFPIYIRKRTSVTSTSLFFNGCWHIDSIQLLWWNIDIGADKDIRFRLSLYLDDNGKYCVKMFPSTSSNAIQFLRERKISNSLLNDILKFKLPKELENIIVDELDKIVKVIPKYIMFGSWTLTKPFINTYCDIY